MSWRGYLRMRWGLHVSRFAGDVTYTLRTPWAYYELHVGKYAHVGEDFDIDHVLERMTDPEPYVYGEPRFWS